MTLSECTDPYVYLVERHLFQDLEDVFEVLLLALLHSGLNELNILNLIFIEGNDQYINLWTSLWLSFNDDLFRLICFEIYFE